MTEESEVLENVPVLQQEVPVESPEEREPMPALESRFLYVGVVSRRVSQLRRGALSRLKELPHDSETSVSSQPKRKLERIAMKEVDKGLIVYELPEPLLSSKGKA